MTSDTKYPWGPDFVNEGTLLGVTTCDSGDTKFSSYDGPEDSHSEVGPYRGMTISINDIVRYFIFSPNQNSMSPITFSFWQKGDGVLEEISVSERDARLKTEAPNLFALFHEQPNDATHESFATQDPETHSE